MCTIFCKLSFAEELTVDVQSQEYNKAENIYIKADPRQQYSRYVRFRPGDGQVVKLNPPRFSWPYFPEIVFKKYYRNANQIFTLQISKTKDFFSLEVEIRNISYNNHG